MNRLLTSYQQLWREPHGALPNTLALGYGILGHLLSFYFLAHGHFLLWLLGLILCAHSLIICAYLVHEAAHMTLFKAKQHHRYVGELLLWLTGAAYGSFDRIRFMHLRHHKDRADVACFDYQVFLKQQAPWFQKLVYALEWAYIPAIELIMHAQVMLKPFSKPSMRRYQARVLVVGASRLAFLYVLFSLSPWALLGYFLAYWIMLQALFLADGFAHTYEAFIVAEDNEPVPQNGRDRQYDEAHTFSNLLSEKHPWLNLWNLNFGYHTAHHEKASVAWHDLPRFHQDLYGQSGHPQVLPYHELWHTVHHNRLKRIFVEDYGDVGDGPGRANGFIGAHGVSFLSIV